ncbi:MAG TPA: ABC transporter ATP-binding protein [Candidatus Saccharimonadales bacterium]|nr:ABC transporter ATP-binding protein [Candidatus Saccharimonadales bacterium]
MALAATAPILEVDRLEKHYGGVRAVDGISFTVTRGAITGLIGPNGAGKSTALAMIGGFVQPSGGRVRFDGVDITGMPMHSRARLGLVRTFQMARVFASLTTLENLLVAAPHQRGERASGVLGGRRLWRGQETELIDQAQAMLQTFSMGPKANDLAGTLSGGQKRAIEIMRALMMQPKLLLLDEPMAGLSPSLSRHLEDVLLDLAEGGLSLLLVEHELETVDKLCGNVVVMAQGKVLSEGRMSELRLSREVQDAYVIG